MTTDSFEEQVRVQLRAVAAEATPAPGLTGRVAEARRRIERRRRGSRLATAAGVGVAAAVLGVFVIPSPGIDVETVGVAAAGEQTSATSFRFETEVEGLGSPVRGEGEVAAGADEARFRATLDEAGGEVEVVLSEETIYVRVPDGAALPLGEGVDWLSVDLDGGGYADRLAASLLRSVGEVDPSRALELLDEVAEGAVEDGTEEVDGVATTRYRFRADVVDGVEVQGRAWVDGDGLLRRVELTRDGVTATTDLFDFGGPTDVDPPPAERVTRLDEVLQERLGGLGGLGGEVGG